jgi:hypothetical protein
MPNMDEICKNCGKKYSEHYIGEYEVLCLGNYLYPNKRFEKIKTVSIPTNGGPYGKDN